MVDTLQELERLEAEALDAGVLGDVLRLSFLAARRRLFEQTMEELREFAAGIEEEGCATGEASTRGAWHARRRFWRIISRCRAAGGEDQKIVLEIEGLPGLPGDCSEDGHHRWRYRIGRVGTSEAGHWQKRLRSFDLAEVKTDLARAVKKWVAEGFVEESVWARRDRQKEVEVDPRVTAARGILFGARFLHVAAGPPVLH